MDRRNWVQLRAGLAGALALVALALVVYRSAGPATTTRADLAEAGYTLSRHDNAYLFDGIATSVSHWTRSGTDSPALVCYVPYGSGSDGVVENCVPHGKARQ